MKKAPILNLRIYDYKNLEELAQVCQEYYDRMYQCESQKYDMEFECRKKDFEVRVELLFSTPGWPRFQSKTLFSLVHSLQPLPLSFKSSLFGSVLKKSLFLKDC